MKYTCQDCGWTGTVLGDREDATDGVVECCPICDGDAIEINKEESDAHPK